MSRRILIIVIVAAVLIIPAVVVLWLVNRSPSLQNKVLQLANTNTTIVNINTNSASNTNTVNNPEADAIKLTARNFAETYGSYNSQNNYANLTDAKAWSTIAFGAYLDRTAVQGQQQPAPAEYQATLTKAVVMKIAKQTAGTATVVVTTQRQDTAGQKVTTYYQDLTLELQKVGDNWLVNAASWASR